MMSYPEKPKRQAKSEDDFSLIVREFYWRLFLHLMTPALILGFLFWLPTVFINNMPDRLTAQCTTYQDNIGVRIISETKQSNLTHYFWTDDSGDTWEQVVTIESGYHSAHANCDDVVFDGDDTQISFALQTIRITADGTVIR